MALYIVIEQRETSRIGVKGRAFSPDFFDNPWPLPAALALIASVAAILLEGHIPRDTTATGFRFTSLLLWGLLAGTVIAAGRATYRYLWYTIAGLRFGRLVTFVEITEGGIALGVRNVWRVGFTWAACLQLRIGRKNITFTFAGARFHVPTEFFTLAEVIVLSDCVRLSGGRVKQ